NAACASALASKWKKRCNTWVSGTARTVTLFALVGSALAAADLHDAVMSGDLERVKREIAGGANVNTWVSGTARTVTLFALVGSALAAADLHDAVMSGDLERVK